MNIAIASGKGGTGKTTIAAALAAYCTAQGIKAAVYDCDVEEPNINLFLRTGIQRIEESGVLIPAVDESLCTGCGECEKICAFNAIVVINGKPLVLPDLCHSCGGCCHVCPTKAITEKERGIGVIEQGFAGGIFYSGGRLNIGEHMSPPLIKGVKQVPHHADVVIIDCPPGTSCPVIEAIRGSDFLILVTEPTPFGLNDLGLAVAIAKELGIPYGVVVNRDGMGSADVDGFCGSNDAAIIAKIPHVRRIAENYSRGDAVTYLLDNHGDEMERVLTCMKEGVRR